MAIYRKWMLLLVVSLLASCSGQGPELLLPSDDQADSGAEISTDSVLEPDDTLNTTDTTLSADASNTGDAANSDSALGQQQGSDQQTNAIDSTVDQNEVADSVPPGTVRIPRVDPINAPKIDAIAIDYIEGTTQLTGEWQSAVQTDSTGQLLGINNFMFGNAEQLLDNSDHHWAAVHDGVYLYVLVISDDAGRHQQDTNETRKPWKDDTVELYFDGNHSRLSSYDGVDDFQFLINLQSSAGVNNNTWRTNSKFFKADVSAPTPADFLFSTGPSKGPQSVDPLRGRKDLYEFRIKISELNIELGKPFGFEVQLNDDDDGGGRDAKWAWAHPVGVDEGNDFTWQNPSYMGTVLLQQ